MQKPDWIKSKGYVHISPQLDTRVEWKKHFNKLTDPCYVKSYAFYPLLHVNLKNRRYKKTDPANDKRSHSYIDNNGDIIKNVKVRPLHYANHMDALIFGYYADLLQIKYETILSKNIDLHEAVTAYRKIPIPKSDKNKSTIHFAHETFEEINKRALENKEVVALAFDIKGFFPSMDHLILKEKWCEVLERERLPDDHYNVFKASTNFSFIYKDDLRIGENKSGRKKGFDEKRLAEIRNRHGFSSFFESNREFRKNIKSGKLRVYKNTFKNDQKEMIGIPQGLPISATLANIYLIGFDRDILNYLVNELGCYYRRYSDDIVIIGDPARIETIIDFIDKSMNKYKVKISHEKTEKFLFRANGNTKESISVFEISKNGYLPDRPFTYLGFEHYGHKTLLKSANISNFYRKMISAVKSKSKIAERAAQKNLDIKSIIFKRQLLRLYDNIDLTKPRKVYKWKTFYKIDIGEYRMKIEEKSQEMHSNYFSYVKRAAKIMEEPAIERQLRNHKKILNQALERHTKKK